MKLLFACSLLFLLSCHHGDDTNIAGKTDHAVQPASVSAGNASSGLFKEGVYRVYQSDAMGFSFQYKVKLDGNGHYTLHDKTNDYTYEPATEVVRFKGGGLDGFIGKFFPDNPKTGEKRVTFVIDFHGEVPVQDVNKKPSGWYQYGFYGDK